MPVSQWKWTTLAEGFPPTLVTNAPKTALKPNESPYFLGCSISAEGYLYAGTIPTATDRTVKTYTISTVSYEWHYNRLWRLHASNPELIYGAPRYTATYYRQGSGEIAFNEDTSAFIKMLPIGETGLILFKTTGAVIIPNAADMNGRFVRSDFMQEAKISTATHAVELDGTVYFANTDGVYAVDIQGKLVELSFPIRTQITPAAVTADYRNKYIIVGTTHAYDVNTKRWLAYSSSTFQYDSPQIRASDQTTPLAVRDIGFDIMWTSTVEDGTGATIEFKSQVDARGWSDTQTLNIVKERGEHAFVHQRIDPDAGREFQMRVTSMPTTLYIKRIAVEQQGFTAESRDT